MNYLVNIFAAVLQINFNLLEYIIAENETLDYISFKFQVAQSPFTLVMTLESIDTAEKLGLGMFELTMILYHCTT